MNHEQTVIDAARERIDYVEDHVEPSQGFSDDPSTCVICLESIFEKAIALPCNHADFDFACLGAWLQRQTSCPLCKGVVNGIKYDLEAFDGPKVFLLPLDLLSAPLHRAPIVNTLRDGLRTHNGGFNTGGRHDSDQGNGLERRRKVYEERLYSLHVGSNRLSKYRNLTPQAFQQDASLLRRAKIWIRRELQVFEFLDWTSTSEGSSHRRARNAEFLGEYVLAILKSIDIRGSTGQAEELLQDFIGRDDARLFLHELGNWLRSPYEQIYDWDEAVQYGSL